MFQHQDHTPMENGEPEPHAVPHLSGLESIWKSIQESTGESTQGNRDDQQAGISIQTGPIRSGET